MAQNEFAVIYWWEVRVPFGPDPVEQLSGFAD